MNNTRRFDVGIQLVGQNTTTPDTAGEIRYNSTLNAFEYFDGTALRVSVSRDKAETLSNKTLTETVSIAGLTGSSFVISSASNQDLSLQGTGTGNVLVETLSVNTNTVTGGASALTVQSASNQNLLLSAQGTGTLTLNTGATARVTVTAAGLVNVSGLTISLPVKTDASKNLVSGAIDLASSEVTGILAITNGGTGSSSKNFVDLTTAQTVGGVKTFSSNVIVNPTTNQLVLGVTNTTTINSVAPSASRIVTLPDAGLDSSFVLNQGASTINGAKTFSSAVTVNPVSNQLVLGTTNTTTISATAPAASRTYTMPDVLANAEFVMSQGSQTVAGYKNYSTQLDVSGFLSFTPQNDATATGAAAEVTPSSRVFVRLTNSSLVSVASIGATDTGRVCVLTNATGNAITILNDSTATANKRILTGTSGNISLAINASLYLVYDNTTQRWRIIGGSGSGATVIPTPTVQKFTSGSGTYTTPTNVDFIRVRMTGGGSGGGGSGTGGTGGTGAVGVASTFGTSLLTANGGPAQGNAYTPTVGGTATITAPAIGSSGTGGGGTGAHQASSAGNAYASGGNGGTNIFSGNGAGSIIGAGVAPTANTGAGGTGGGTNGINTSISGAGGSAGGWVDSIIAAPSSTYSYTIGTGGAGGSAGTSGFAGTAGSTGYIEVIEFYKPVGVPSTALSLNPTSQKFLTGSGTYTTPANVAYIRVRMIGGGGGGSTSGTAGSTAATPGGNSTFGSSLLTANGGGAGIFAGSANAGGSATINSPAIGSAFTGGVGQMGGTNTTVSAAIAPGGQGGNSPFGGAGSGTWIGVGAAAAANSGSGGGGGMSSSTQADNRGGTGGSAGGYIDAIVTAPSSTYTYAVGAGGSAGLVGTNGSAGGAGGSGIIIVDEFYYAVGVTDGTGQLIPSQTGNSAKYLTTNGTAPSWSAFTPPSIQRFTSSSGTYTTPAGVKWIKVKLVAGGGGGAGAGTSTAGTGGTAGGSTTFGTSLLTATGGGGGDQANLRGGAGGAFTVNSPAIDSGSGSGNGAGSVLTSGSNAFSLTGSDGGSSPFGGAGRSGNAGDAGFAASTNSGSGGGGGGSAGAIANCNGGPGGGSGGYIKAIIANPSSTYSYAIGAAGTAGGAGTNGRAGGTGGSGLIIVEEYYQ